MCEEVLMSRGTPWSAPWAGATISILATLNAVAAAAGALGLATGFLDLTPGATDRLPWSSPVVGGVALAVLVAVPNAWLSVLALRRDRRTPITAVVVGAGMVVWIGVELAFIHELSFFHPLYVVLGLVMMLAGLRLMRSRDAVPAGSVARQN